MACPEVEAFGTSLDDAVVVVACDIHQTAVAAAAADIARPHCIRHRHPAETTAVPT